MNSKKHLTPFRRIVTFVGVGAALVINFEPVRPIVRSHHERLDGSGYPDGLRGSDVPLLAQILAIVDVYDALTTTRSYRAMLSAEQACDELKRETARGLHDSNLLIREFLALAESGGLTLAAGSIA